MSDFECHNVARRTSLLALSATDTDYTADTTYLCEAWQLLLERRDIEVSDLYHKLSVATQCGRNIGEHVNECMHIEIVSKRWAPKFRENSLFKSCLMLTRNICSCVHHCAHRQPSK